MKKFYNLEALFYVAGDEILEVNGDSIDNLSHREVLSKFRKLKKGPVTITFRKRTRSPHCR